MIFSKGPSFLGSIWWFHMSSWGGVPCCKFAWMGLLHFLVSGKFMHLQYLYFPPFSDLHVTEESNFVLGLPKSPSHILRGLCNWAMKEPWPVKCLSGLMLPSRMGILVNHQRDLDKRDPFERTSRMAEWNGTSVLFSNAELPWDLGDTFHLYSSHQILITGSLPFVRGYRSQGPSFVGRLFIQVFGVVGHTFVGDFFPWLEDKPGIYPVTFYSLPCVHCTRRDTEIRGEDGRQDQKMCESEELFFEVCTFLESRFVLNVVWKQEVLF